MGNSSELSESCEFFRVVTLYIADTVWKAEPLVLLAPMTDFYEKSDDNLEKMGCGTEKHFTFGIGSSTGLSGMVREDFAQQLVSTLLEQIDNGVVQGILVLFQPTGDVVWDLNNARVRPRTRSVEGIENVHYQRNAQG